METINSDILIVGAGLAGFTAAVRASEQGAKVLLIDKSHGELGDGNVLMASGSLRAGGKSPKTGAKELYDFVMSEGVGYPDLVKAWSETCGRAIDWLQTVGVEIEETAPGRIWLNQKSEISSVRSTKKTSAAARLTSLKKQFLNLGGSYLNGSEGVRLIVENSRVTGLIAKQDGERSNCAPARRFLPPAASAPTQSWSRNISAPTPTDASCAVPNRTPATVCAWRLPSAPRRSI